MMNCIRTQGRRAARTAVLSLVLALAVLAAAAPQTANAQTTATCRAFYVFREGDTKPRVAHTFDLSWREIADANDLNTAEKVEVGERLCIPEGEDDDGDSTTPAGSSNAKIQVSIAGSAIRISVDDFSNRHSYLVKVRPTDTGVSGWTKLGRIQVVRNDAQSFSFSLPNDLRDTARLSVCLKDMTTDELICRTAANP